MKTEAKQINKLLAGFFSIPTVSVTSGSASVDVTSALVTALSTASFGSTALPNITSVSEVTSGIVVVGSQNENIVLIDKLPGLGKIVAGDKTVFGKITAAGSTYIVSFYYLDVTGTHVSYTLPTDYTITLKVPYRFELKNLPTDVIIKIQQWWLNGSTGGGAGVISTWEDTISGVKALTSHNHGSDSGCFGNQAIYEYDATSILTPDDDLVLKPDDITLPASGRWIKKLTIGEITYTNSHPSTASNLEGIPAGSTFSGLTMKQMWDKLLYPYQFPVFSSFNLSGYTTLEVGIGIPVGSKTFNWLTTNPINVNTNSIGISGPGMVAASSLPNTGNATINFTSIVNQSVPGSRTWTITGINTQSSNFNKTYTVNWMWSVYWGESAAESLAASGDVLGLRTNALATVAASSRSYVYAELQYKYFCYPSDWADPTSFKRADTGMTVPGFIQPGLVSVVKNGVTKQYKVWRSYEKLEGAQTIIIS